MIITATNGIVYNSFTGDVYVLNTASITLTAGTLTADTITDGTLTITGGDLTTRGDVTAEKFVGATLAEYFNIAKAGIGTILTTVEGFQINTGVNEDIVLNSGRHVLFDLGSDAAEDHFDIRNSSSAVLFRLAGDGDIDTMPIIKDGFTVAPPDGIDGESSGDDGTSAEDIVITGGLGGDAFDDGGEPASGGNASKVTITLKAGGDASSGGGTPGTDGVFTVGDEGVTNFLSVSLTGSLGFNGSSEVETDMPFKTLVFPVFDKASGNGIKVDTTTPTFGFADLLGDVTVKNTGGSRPALIAYKDGLVDFEFAAGEEEYFKYHIPHDYVKGTDIFLHFHWSTNGALVNGGTVTFDYEMSYAKAHAQAAFPASVSGTVVSATASSTQYTQELTEVQVSASAPSGSQIDTDDLEPDGIIICTAGLNANNLTVSSGGVPDPFIHYVDIHYQTTGLIGTKAKVPDFYA